MTRKFLLVLVAVIGAALTFLKAQFGLSIDATAVVGAITLIVVYVFGEAKADMARLKAQANKWGDPKFLATFLGAIIVPVVEAFGLTLPTEIIQAVLAAIVALLFKLKK